jgi:hypothetical protein
MTKNNLKLLDIDEDERPSMEFIHGEALRICQEKGWTLDCATSDVVIFLVGPKYPFEAAEIAGCYPNAEYKYEEGTDSWVIF